FGRGQGRLDLNGLDLERLRIYNQKGDLEIDLSGKTMTKDIIIWMNNHQGDIRLKIPAGAGAQVTTVRGAEIEAPDFTQKQSIYTNERYEQSAYRIFIDVQSLDGNVIIQ
ncbi:MAG: cell wall-active antibiotics response protein, partial [Candidatus Omnitrophica bacterium]|nr:cell wall-active antibiotics response protein [Candidatus Omnitrophota bacterium]